jgi:diacylglycerol kinase family enzyme
MPQFCFIFNPHSGLNRRRPQFLVNLRARIAALGLDAEFRSTERPHHATELARDAATRGIPRIVAVGGDGTLNEVGCGVVGTASALGLIPAVRATASVATSASTARSNTPAHRARRPHP